MDADEKAIVAYLKTWSGQFVSGREVSRRAGGKWRFRENPEWATAVMTRMVEKGIIESDSTGHYRLTPMADDGKRKTKKWVSPQMRKILEQSGKDFGEVLTPEEGDNFYTDR